MCENVWKCMKIKVSSLQTWSHKKLSFFHCRVFPSVFLLVVFVIFILIAYRRKSTESTRVLKNMKDQMDVLELRVAAECKEVEYL